LLSLERFNAQHQKRESVSSSAEPAVGKPTRHRVLLVEDHAGVAEATAAFLRLHDLNVQVASSGVEALKIAEEFHPVLVLCDLWLPDMTGDAVARALRARPGASDFIFAMLTAMNVAELRELERETDIHGVNRYLSKPITSETLSDLLARVERLQRPVRRPR
jgi:CheY-like chemotaxis protein